MDRTKTVAGLSALLLAACSPPPQIVVGSKNFTEQALLAEIVAQQIERRLSLQVGRKFNLGGTLLAHRALTSGAIDLYPEYSGTALTAVLKQPPLKDPAAALTPVYWMLLGPVLSVWWPPAETPRCCPAYPARGLHKRRPTCRR